MHGNLTRVLVAGVDGCRGGWVVVYLDGIAIADVEVVADLRVLIDSVRNGTLAAAAIDMPIGLPHDRPRASDRELRRWLGRRRSTVFPTPARTVLDAADYADALTRNRESLGVGLSRQAWNLVPKIRELDKLMAPELQPRISEAHPESSFAAMNEAALTTRKSTPEGRDERRALLDNHLRSTRALDTATAPIVDLLDTATAPIVDLLDACAAAWTAHRIASGTARWFGDIDERDSRGLYMTVAV